MNAIDSLTYRIKRVRRALGFGWQMLALPAPSEEALQALHSAQLNEVTRQITAAEMALGMRLRYGPNNEAILYPKTAMSGNGRGGKVVAVFQSPPDLESVLRSGTPSFAVISRPVPIDTSAFQASVQSALDGWSWSRYYSQFLQAARDHFLYGAGFVRELVITGDAAFSLGVKPGAPTSIAQGRPLKANEFACLLREVISQRLCEVSGHLQNGDHPLVFANTLLRVCLGGYAVHSETLREVGLWQVRWPWKLEDLLKLPVTLHTQVENLGGKSLYLWATVRAAGTPTELEDIGRSLARVSRAERVSGWDITGMDALTMNRRTLPGSPKPVPGMPFSEPAWRDFLRAMANSANAALIKTGDLAVGKTLAGQTIFRQSSENRAVAIEGETGSGKTITAMLYAFARTPHVIFIHLTPCADDSPGKFAKKLGGQQIVINLPQPKSVDEFNQAAVQIEQEVERRVQEMKSRWRKEGYLAGLPMVIQPGSGSTSLYAFYITCFLRHLRPAIEAYFLRTRKRLCVVFDDLVGIPNTPDQNVGELSVTKGQELRYEIQLSVDTCRKLGFDVILTVHSREEFAGFGDGFWPSIPLCVRLIADSGHRRAEIWSPSQTRLGSGTNGSQPGLLGSFDPWLPPTVRESLEAK